MDKQKLSKILTGIREGHISISDAMQEFEILPFHDLGFAKIDTHREIRRSFPEVILCQGKTKAQIQTIASESLKRTDFLMATRATKSSFQAIAKENAKAVYYESARIVLVGEKKPPLSDKVIVVVTAGTSDFRVAEEAAVTAEIMGNHVERLFDIGVAGIHRLFSNLDVIKKGNVLIAVAGMEGALASVVSGLVDRPVIAVPTSVGYGVATGGFSALLTMLGSCSPGISVVNIDNGFGAGYQASLINRLE